MKRIIWIIVIIIAVILVAFAMQPRPIAVDLGTPTLRTVQEYIAEDAKTRLADEYVVDMPISGTLKKIPHEIGDVVQQGDVVAILDDYDLKQQILQLESLIEQARAQMIGVDVTKPKAEDINTAAIRVQEAKDALRIAQKEQEIATIDYKKAKREYERIQHMAEQGIASTAQLDQAERLYFGLDKNRSRASLAVDIAQKKLTIAELAYKRVTGSIDDNEYQRQALKAEVDSIEAQLNILKSDLEKTKLYAPVTGPVLEKHYEHQRALMAGTPLLKIGDLGTMEIECDVLSEEVGMIELGDTVLIEGKALGDAEASGTVKRIYPAAFMKISALGIEQQRVKTLIDFDNTQLQLRAGTRIDVKIITDAHDNTLALPERATFRREGQWYIFAANDGTAELRPVTIGLKNDQWAEITDGLNKQDTVVLEPRNDLEPGMKVTARE